MGTHPCFEPHAKHEHSRVHLPVAPRCNVQCQFCSRRYDCAAESRPGVTSTVLGPEQALWWLDRLRPRLPDLSVVGIAGPGDPCANPVQTLATLRGVRARHPDLILCLSTNGLALSPLVSPLARAGVEHLTVTVNAIDPEIGARVYRWVREGDEVLTGEAGARRLLLRQVDGIRRAVAAGMQVKVNAIAIPGVNDDHLPQVASAMRDLGVAALNLMPFRPVAGSGFAALPAPAAAQLAALRRDLGAILPVLSHCGQCRADAAGRIGQDNDPTVNALLWEASAMSDPVTAKPHVAVVSLEGMFVNSHLGHASELLIYAARDDAFELVDVRPAPPEGGGAERWQELAELLGDCRAVVASAAGATPERALGAHGIRVLCTDGLIEDALEAVFTGREDSLLAPSCRSGTRCGGSSTGCTGAGMACA